jgi:hypothetical protein
MLTNSNTNATAKKVNAMAPPGPGFTLEVSNVVGNAEGTGDGVTAVEIRSAIVMQSSILGISRLQ